MAISLNSLQDYILMRAYLSFARPFLLRSFFPFSSSLSPVFSLFVFLIAFFTSRLIFFFLSLNSFLNTVSSLSSVICTLYRPSFSTFFILFTTPSAFVYLFIFLHFICIPHCPSSTILSPLAYFCEFDPVFLLYMLISSSI